MNMEGWKIGKSDSEFSISAFSAISGVKSLFLGTISENEHSEK